MAPLAGGRTPPPHRGAGSLRIICAAHRVLAARRPFSVHDHAYFTDLLSAHGIALDEQGFALGRVSFTELVAALVPDLGPYADRFDLALMASMTADAEPGWPMCYLSETVPMAGLAFAIADQGAVAPFTALRLAADRARTDGARRVLVFILDQQSVLHTRPVPDRQRAREDCGVVLVLDGGPAGEHGATVHVPEPCLAEPADVPALWAGVAALARGSRPVTAVTGPGLHGLAPSARGSVEVLHAPAGRPCSGIWSVFAARLPGWRACGHRVLLADYDPDLGRLAWCVIDIPRDAQEVPGT